MNDPDACDPLNTKHCLSVELNDPDDSKKGTKRCVCKDGYWGTKCEMKIGRLEANTFNHPKSNCDT